MENVIKLGIVDDEKLIVEAFTFLLSTEKYLKFTLVSSNGNDIFKYLESLEQCHVPDIFLVDIKMEPMDGFTFVEQLKSQFPTIKIIVLTSYYTQNYLGRLLKLGISAFVSKSTEKDELIKVINTVFREGVYFTERDLKVILGYLQKNTSAYKEVIEFSARELEIINLLCKEHTNQEIAEILFISKRTVETHRQRILERIGAKNTIGLVIYAIMNELVSIDFKS